MHPPELLRIAANRLQLLPDWLLTLPRLSWLAFAGNPFSDANEAASLARHSLPAIARAQVILHEQLGQGASGVIHRAQWQVSGQRRDPWRRSCSRDTSPATACRIAKWPRAWRLAVTPT